MEIGDETLYCKRQFGYAKIEWQIENYFIETCKKRWSVYSPVFSVRGHQVTKWRLNFRGTRLKDEIFASVYLERSESDSFPHKVRVNWKLIYPWEIYHHYKSENTFIFNKKSSFGMAVHDFEMLANKLHSTSTEILRVQCSLMVYADDNTAPHKAIVPGFKSLSQDLAVINKLQHHVDLLLNTDNITIGVHKAVLFSRVEKLRTVMDNTEIELPDLDADAAKKVLSFSYTANLDYVLRIPSFNIVDCINFFDIKELESYYKCDELTLSTHIGVREYCFSWFIEDIKSKHTSCIISKVFNINSGNLSFRLHLYTNGFNEKSEYMSIFIEMIEGDWPNYLSVEFGIVGLYGFQHYRQRMRCALEDGSKQGIEKFVLRDIINNNAFVWFSMLSICCKICISDSSEVSSNVISKIKCSPNIIPEYHYELLSIQIARLFETGEFSDFTIRCRNTEFKVHKCILSARSHKFKEIVNKPENAINNSTCVTDLEPEILSHVFFYMYSGRLQKHEFCDVFKIYAAAERFFVLPLKYACTDVLRNSIEMMNVSDILKLSDQLKDFKLKLSAFKFICKNVKSAIEKFRESKTYNEKLMSEYFKFVTRYAVQNREQMLDASF